MVASEFLDYFNKFRGIGQVGVEDFADKFNAIYTVAVLIICGLVITVKQYFMAPLSCYTATKFEGGSIEGYLNNYCWVEGTITIPVGDPLPIDDEGWKKLDDKKIMYYQWIPFVLALQCVLFIIPRFIWQMLTYNRTGTDLERLVTLGCEAASDDPDSQAKKIRHIAATIKNVVLATRDVRQGKLAQLRRKLHGMFAFSVISKRMGTWLATVYLLMKLAYLFNNIGQIYMMQRFLGLHKNYTYFGLEIAKDIATGKDWQQTEVFPRVTFCRVPIQHLGAINYQTSQCVLGINFINEKVYIFLWFWLVVASIFTILSIPVWLCRLMGNQSKASFIKKNLLITNKYRRCDRHQINDFVERFLRPDGLFVLRMLSLNAGDLVTSEVLADLWQAYVKEFKDRDMCDDRLLPTGDDELLPRDAPYNKVVHPELGGIVTPDQHFPMQPQKTNL